MNDPRIVGLQPWLPWPFRLWRSWTEPARAERLAALRIGLAFVLFLDVLTTYWPHLDLFFGPESLCRTPGQDPFGYFTEPPRWAWSILRGLGNPNNFALLMGVWTIVTVLAVKAASPSNQQARIRWISLVWTMTTILAVLSLWVRLEGWDYRGELVLKSGIGLGFAVLAWCLAGFVYFWHGRRQGKISSAFLLPGISTSLLLGIGIVRYFQELETGQIVWQLSPFLTDWDQQPAVLRGFMVAWLTAVFLLLVGFWTRPMTIAVWILTNSFDNLNPQINNNGDVARQILLFFLVVSPCGTVWSLDRCLKRDTKGPIFIYPWVLRLVFLQMVVIYFVNGVYKVFGEQWREGISLYYVLANPAMSRVSYAQFPLPPILLQVLSWTVLVWELLFPLLVALRWTRAPALILGVLFHLGIWASLELGFFSAYMLTMYLPLVPWERLWKGPKETKPPTS
jgi:hypothetical protein